MPNENQEEKLLSIDITDYWMILNKRFFQIVLVFLLVVAITFVYTMKQVPTYQAESRVRISARSPMATIEGAAITWYGAGSSNSISSEIELILSKDEILGTVVDFLKDGSKCKSLSNENAEYYTENEKKDIALLSFSDEEKKYIGTLSPGALRGLIKIDTVNVSDIISITTKNRYPSVAVAISNIVAMVYRADFWRTKTQDARDTRDFIRKRLDIVKKDIDEQTKNLESASEQTVSLGSAMKYQDELSTLKMELQRLKETYQDGHPRIVKQKNLIKSVEDELAKFPKTKQTYDDKLADWKLKQGQRRNLGEYLIKAEIDYEAKRTKSMDEVQMVSKAKMPASKLSPNETMNMIAGGIFGLIVACLYAFIWEGLDTSIGKIEDVERVTGLPVIAHIPFIGNKGRKKWGFFKPFRFLFKTVCYFLPFKRCDEPLDLDKKILFNFDILSMTAEAYRTLRTNIQFALGTQKTTGIVVGITSTSPREGKTLTSTNLAISLAQMGKVTLLLEGDLRRPQIADLFKISEKPGLSDILVGTAKMEDAIKTFTDVLIGNAKWENLLETPGVDNLNIITCGTLPPNPTELLISNEFRELIQKLRNSYDFIIIDTPPTLPVSDSSIISTVTDGTILIYQSDTTSRHLLLRALHTLKKNHAKLLGIVINQLSFDVVLRSNKNRYNYGYGYGYGYGYRSDKPK